MKLNIAVQPNKCKNDAVLITYEEFGGNRCMESDLMRVRFETCNSLNTEQQWVIWTTGNDDYIRIFQRVENGGFFAARIRSTLPTHYCLQADSGAFTSKYYQTIVQSPTDSLTGYSKPIEPNKEERLQVFTSTQ